MMNAILFLALLILLLGIYIVLSLRLGRFATKHGDEMSYYRGNQMSFEIVATIFLGAIWIYSFINDTPGTIVSIFLFLLIIGWLILFDPYLYTIVDDDNLQVKTLTKIFLIPIRNIKKISRFLSSVYMNVKQAGFPFGFVTMGYYYVAEDPELEKFIKRLQTVMNSRT